MPTQWLLIDTCERGQARFAWLQAYGRPRMEVKKLLPGAVIGSLASFVAGERLTKSAGICIVTGPGSFSAVRSGVLAANLLARFHRLPLYAISRHEARSLTELRNRLIARRVSEVPYAAPVYDAEPNITCPSH